MGDPMNRWVYFFVLNSVTVLVHRPLPLLTLGNRALNAQCSPEALPQVQRAREFPATFVGFGRDFQQLVAISRTKETHPLRAE